MCRSILIQLVGLSLVVALTPVLSAQEGQIYQEILEGNLDRAREMLSAKASAATRDGDLLFYQSLLETDGAEAAKSMEAALNASVSTRHQEEIFYRLAQYYWLTRAEDKLQKTLTDYRARWESGKYQAEMVRLSMLLDELHHDYESALRQCDRYLLTYKTRDDQQRGQIDKARIMLANAKGVGSSKTLRELSRAKDGEGIPVALYVLGLEAASKQQLDNAVLNYNLLREEFPGAVGLETLISRLGTISSGTPSDDTAEKLTGTFYSVKVGVFSEKGNANKHADTFKRYNKRVEVLSREISGKQYYVVYVGRFQKYEDAVQFKVQLEAAHNEAFQVVTR